MAYIVLSGLTKRFGDVTVVDAVDLTVEDRELMVHQRPLGLQHSQCRCRASSACVNYLEL